MGGGASHDAALIAQENGIDYIDSILYLTLPFF